VGGKLDTKATLKFTTTTKAKIDTFLTYEFENTGLSHYSLSSSGDVPVETLSLNFTKIKWELTAQKDDGTKEGTAASTWDMAANKLVK